MADKKPWTPRQLDVLTLWVANRNFRSDGANGRIGGNVMRHLTSVRGLIRSFQTPRTVEGITYYHRTTLWTREGLKYAREVLKEHGRKVPPATTSRKRKTTAV